MLVQAGEPSLTAADEPVQPASVQNQESESRETISRGEILAELKRIREQLERLEKAIGQSSEAPKIQPENLQSTKSEEIEPQIHDGIKLFHDAPIEKLVEGTIVPLGNGHHVFEEIPKQLQGRKYTKRGGYQGNLRFEVLQAQTVWVAMYGNDWGGGGNPSGDWQKEIVTAKEMLAQGWKEFGLLPVKHSNPEYQNEPAWIVFERDCQVGDALLIRNHKYQAPILIWGEPAQSSEKK